MKKSWLILGGLIFLSIFLVVGVVCAANENANENADKDKDKDKDSDDGEDSVPVDEDKDKDKEDKDKDKDKDSDDEDSVPVDEDKDKDKEDKEKENEGGGWGSGSSSSSKSKKKDSSMEDSTSVISESSEDVVEVKEMNQEREGVEEDEVEIKKVGESNTLKSKGVEAVSNLKIEKKGNKIEANVSDGSAKEIKILPDTASRISLSKLKSKQRTLELREIIREGEAKVVYISEAERKSKVLGLFETKYLESVVIDSETGDVLEISKPWWTFIATEPLEEEGISDLPLQQIKSFEEVSFPVNKWASFELDDYFFNADQYFVSEPEEIYLVLEDSTLTIVPRTNWTGETSFSVKAIKQNQTLEALIDVSVI